MVPVIMSVVSTARVMSCMVSPNPAACSTAALRCSCTAQPIIEVHANASITQMQSNRRTQIFRCVKRLNRSMLFRSCSPVVKPCHQHAIKRCISCYGRNEQNFNGRRVGLKLSSSWMLFAVAVRRCICSSAAAIVRAALPSRSVPHQTQAQRRRHQDHGKQPTRCIRHIHLATCGRQAGEVHRQPSQSSTKGGSTKLYSHDGGGGQILFVT